MTEENFLSYKEGVVYLKRKDKKLAWLMDKIGTISYAEPKDDFQFLVEQIVGQMLSMKVAKVMTGRLTDLGKGEITADVISRLTTDELRSIGISMRKAEYIRQLAWAVEEKRLNFETLKQLPDDELMKALTAVKGIGPWTAKMYLYKIHRPDVLPFEDVVFLSAYKWLYRTKDVKPEAVKRRCKKWSPYSSIASMYLYTAFGRGLIAMDAPKLKDL